MVSEKLTNTGTRFLNVAYAVLGVLSILFLLVVIPETYIPPENYKNYPFGSETGWNYTTPEVYMFSNRLVSFILLQSMALSAICYRYSKERTLYLFFALSALIVPFVFAYFCLPSSGK